MAVLSTTNLKLNYQQLANTMGPGCSASAIQHRIQRLKAMVASNDNNKDTNTNAAEATEPATKPATEPATTSAPSSPEQVKKKRGRPAKQAKETDEPAPKRPKRSLPKRGKKAKAAAESDNTDDA
ncbi:hypothetical protein BDW42DRAFT_195672 [Aspergillus taichungensis]|uniref:AT hook motif protein n=1 Tax=Aspergillus taichungensis TaxID=482145 RepID=A0A2J5HNE1_9EURO|nr:hypothetical protein BDW42DRAFT_195672 [Aspergillus taichungensis]